MTMIIIIIRRGLEHRAPFLGKGLLVDEEYLESNL